MLRSFQQRAEQIVSGFKSPADDYLEGRLNIADVLVIDPHCTFYFKMDSQAMEGYGIAPGDLLVIDRSLKPIEGAIVIAVAEGTLYCRRYQTAGGKPCLAGDTDVIKETGLAPLQIWGVVTAVCRNVLPNGLRKGRYQHVCAL